MRKRKIKQLRREYNIHSASKILKENPFDDWVVAYKHTDGINLKIRIYIPEDKTNINPYFIIFNGGPCKIDATACCRISCIEPRYIIPGDSRLKHFNLNKNEIDWLMNILTKGIFSDDGRTGWQYIIWAYMHQLTGEENIDYNKYPIPDYYKLLDDIHPDYLSIFNKKKRR